ncbi:MTRF1L release factor glutamine methyltransferase [Lamellibrachia satsuma]|nr:MTRF1L release factor glutamine methyltransferase [Lamellibrachia satsuma]
MFLSCNISEPDQSAQYIVSYVLGHKTLHHVDLMTMMSASQLHEVSALTRRRLDGCPVQYVLGEWDFRDLTLRMEPPVFIPRPETEELVSLVLDDPVVKNSKCFIEIGCGSGAICLSLLSERPELFGIALERSAPACRVTTQNAVAAGVEQRLELLHETLGPGTFQERVFHQGFDFLVSNPPYIKTADMDTLQSEVADFEDHNALHGGMDGLNVIRMILQGAAHILKPRGSVWLEVDSGHPPLIQDYVENDQSLGLIYVKTYTDFRGMPRFCHLQRIPE